MNSLEPLRALVVDDEPALRRLLLMAMKQQGFSCDIAEDGEEAEHRLRTGRYDAVVTDLAMPNRHGHALASQLLSREEPPVVVIYTGVAEPRIAKDLLARGVDDIIFKPCDLGVLAAKVRVMVERRRGARRKPVESAVASDAVQSLFGADDAGSASKPVSLVHLESKLRNLSRVMPISNTALDVYAMTSTDEWGAEQIAAAVQRDATLAAEVLKLANSPVYNTTGHHIGELRRAVVQIGHNRIGEIALASNALGALTAAVVPWMDLGLAWMQSMAAGLAIELLVEEGGHEEIEEGLLLCAVMHPLGRVVLGSMFPHHYRRLTQKCEETGESLQELEQVMFPLSHSRITARLLESWNIPAAIYRPLDSIDGSYASLSRLSGAARYKAELVKTAIFIGRLAVGRWEPWDFVDIPPGSVLRRLRIESLPELLHDLREDVGLLANFRPSKEAARDLKPQPPRAQSVKYCNVTDNATDLVAALVTSLGVDLKPVDIDALKTQDSVLVNALGPMASQPSQLQAIVDSDSVVITANNRLSTKLGAQDRLLKLPCSFANLERRLKLLCGKSPEPKRKPPALSRH